MRRLSLPQRQPRQRFAPCRTTGGDGDHLRGLPWHRERPPDPDHGGQGRHPVKGRQGGAHRSARKHHSVRPSLQMEPGWQEAHPAIRHGGESGVGDPADDRYGRSRLRALQHHERLRQDPEARREKLGLRAG